jgi:hypothetical protein
VVLLAAVAIALGQVAPAIAQPLVTEGLSIYYSFDSVDEDGIWEDGSGNNLHGLTAMGDIDANGDGLPDIRFDPDDKVRGAGSVWFDTHPDEKEEYIAVCDTNTDYIENCETAENNGLLPEYGFSVAAWVKVMEVGQDQSIWQTRATDGGFTHTQIQGAGNLRVTLRGSANTDTFVNYNEPPGGELVEFETWNHFVTTYEKPDPDGFGQWAVYWNGELVAADESNGPVAGDPDFEVMGNWDQGAFIGLVPDFARQLVGRMDEFYLFHRALSEEEVQILYTMPDEGGGLTGDFNGNGLLDAEDIDLLGVEIAAGTNGGSFDLNGDNVVNINDRDVWVNDLKSTYYGDANLDGEFNSGDLVFVFTAGHYEDGVADNSGWAQGDWNGDKDFDSSDFVTAFSAGGYEQGPRAAVASVPEPSSVLLIVLGGLGLMARRRR